MAKYKIGDIFINHKDGKILQVCEGRCGEKCCYSNCWKTLPFSKGITCTSLVGICNHVEELPTLPPGTKVKIREDLKEGVRYASFLFTRLKGEYKEITIKTYDTISKSYVVNECSYRYTLEMFDQVINEPKINNMETREIKINVPEGYEIDKENSTFECIKFKPSKLTYEDVAKKLFSNACYYTNEHGKIDALTKLIVAKEDKNNATNKRQLERLMALNQLLNIAEYYNRKNPKEEKKIYCIDFDKRNLKYFIQDYTCSIVIRGLVPKFNNKEDAIAVINNSNFKNILDLVYKGNED